MADTSVLIVEDEAIVARDLRHRLEDMGYRVAGMTSRGEEAVELAAALRPSLVLMDIHLAGEMDGIQAAGWIRSHCHIPVVYLTAYADEPTLERAKITEPFGYILKPFEERELQTTIEIALYRHRAETALRESEERYRDLFDNANDLIQSVGPDGHFLYVNRAWQQALGYTDEEAGALHYLDVVHPEFRASYQKVFERLLAGEKDDRVETDFVAKDGRVISVEGSSGCRFENGRPVAARSIFRDVTAAKQASRLMQQQNEYLMALHETTLGLMRHHEIQDLLQAIITHAARLVGTQHGYVFLEEPGEADIRMRVGIGVYDGFVGTRARLGVGLAGTVWQTGNPIVVDDYRHWQGRLPDSSRDVLRAVAGVPLKAGGRTMGVIGLAYTDTDEGRRFGESEIDALHRFAELASLALENARLSESSQRELAERRRAEEETRRAEEFVNQIIENIPHMIFVKDAADLRFVRWNKAGEELMGVPREQMVGKTDYDLYPREQADFFTGKDREALANGELLDIAEEPVDTRYRGRRWLHTKKIPIGTGNGHPRYLLGIAEDITDYKFASEQRQALERKMQEAQKLESLGVLAGGIAHDFNNLLVSVLGNVGLVLLDLDPISPVREPIEQIKIAAQRAADLTKQMLAYSGKGRFVMQAVNVNSLIEEMSQLLRVSISKSASLKFDLAPNLPLIEADATQIRQIVMNLIVNASDAVGTKPGTISVRTGCLRADKSYLSQTYMSPDLKEGTYIFLEVADTGCGMDEETRRRIFDPFFTTKFTGRGLGLAAVLGILRGHEGAIKVYSEVGHGSVFRVLLPTKDQELAVKETEVRKFERGNGHVLVVDDEEVVRMVTRRMLERFGYTPLIAEDGYAGLELLSQHRDKIVCILLDMTMPRMSGEETFREILKIKPDARVVLMSGYPEMEATRRFKGDGLMGFMQKPYTPEDLQEKIHAAVTAKQHAV